MDTIGRRVSLFVTCLVDQIRPSVGVATVELLRRLGCDVVFDARQTCCGQPAFTSGFWNDARAVARRTIEVLEDDRSDWIVTPSGSCGAMFHHYEKLFAEDGAWLDRARQINHKVRELSVFLVDELGEADFGVHYDGRLTWHDACHGLRDLGIREQPRKIIRNIKGAEFVETEKCDTCCGFGGVFSVNYPGISTSMAHAKLDEITAMNIDAVVSGDVGCLMQMKSTSQYRDGAVRFLHLAELLAGMH